VKKRDRENPSSIVYKHDMTEREVACERVRECEFQRGVCVCVCVCVCAYTHTLRHTQAVIAVIHTCMHKRALYTHICKRKKAETPDTNVRGPAPHRVCPRFTQ